MMLLSKPPEVDEKGMAAYYRRCAGEGAVFRGSLNNVSFGQADDFDPEWSVASVCWCAGGTEKYEFCGQRHVRLKAGAILAIGEQERYSFSTGGERSLISSMIMFPTAMTRALRRDALDDVDYGRAMDPIIQTRQFRPNPVLMSRMNAIASACQSQTIDTGWLEEQSTLVAASVLTEQIQDEQRPNRLEAVKPSTRDELARRLRRAMTLIYDCYDDPALDLSALAREACIARYHFVRVFAAAYGVTPLRFLGEVRMDAAARLLESVDAPIAEVARSVGFSNRSAFQRRFHRQFGSTPAQWRRQSASQRPVHGKQ